ncbi:MAG: HlyD family efflux transporter periplasmic adaptor subunit [Acidobacteria bacterium]|nr:HlyD family efflux transporter periplasmic adaptor subunit [Acidobacteriota bacterium]
MPEFVRSHEFLRGDGLRWPALKIALCLVLLAGWVYWFCRAEIGVYETSDASEIETNQEIYPVQVEVNGRISSSSLALGRRVLAGELLLEIEDSEQRLQLNEMQARLRGLGPQLDHLHQEINNQRAALERGKDELSEARLEAESRSREAQSRAAFAGHQADQDRELYSLGIISGLDRDRAVSNARQQVAVADAALASAAKTEKQEQRDLEEHLANIQSLERQASGFEADRQTLAAGIERLQHALDRCRVYAPVGGILAEVEPVKSGTVVEAGQKVATILPSGGLKVVAQFMPAAVAGRIKPGEPARLLVDRFSWSQYGAVPLTVETVGADLQDGHIKVELLVKPKFRSTIPLQHGLRGTTEVLVERATPLAIALRVAGRYLGGQAETPTRNSASVE